MVGDEVPGWNPFLDSLLHLTEKLEEIGIVYTGGEVAYTKTKGVSYFMTRSFLPSAKSCRSALSIV